MKKYRQEYFDKGELTIHGDGGLDEAGNYEQWIEKINADLKNYYKYSVGRV